MKLYTTFIPPSQIVDQPLKIAQRIPEQAIIQTIDVYEEAMPFIECKMRNTIRHEAQHRKDEEEGRPEGMQWEQWSAEGRVEPIAEKAETEDCESLQPETVSNTVSVNTDEVFQRAKSSAGIDPAYLSDVKAAILPDHILGMYGMQDMPKEFTGWDGSQYINVTRFFKDWIVGDNHKTLPPNIQDDGMEPDPDLRNIPGYGVSSTPPAPSGVPSASVPSIPSVPSVGAR